MKTLLFENMISLRILTMRMSVRVCTEGANIVPSLLHPLQSLHNRSPSPPLFRDFDLPSLHTRRPEEIIAPSNLLGTIPDGVVDSYQLPVREDSSLGLGRRIPPRTEALSIHPGRNTNGNRPPS